MNPAMLIWCGLLLWWIVVLAVGVAPACAESPIPAGAATGSVDVFFKTPGVPSGPPAPAAEEIAYPTIGSFDSRLLVWFVTQQHTYFGGFVLALPIFCVLIEFLGLIVRDPALAARYDRLAKDFARVALLAMQQSAEIEPGRDHARIEVRGVAIRELGELLLRRVPEHVAEIVPGRAVVRLELDRPEPL